MDVSHVETLVDQHIEPLKRALGLSDWRTVVNYGPIDAERRPGFFVPASCDLNPPYRKASISIDPAEVDSEEDLFRYLLHELLHIVLSPTVLLDDAVARAVSDEKYEVLRPVWHDTLERCIANLERFLKSTGLDAKELIERARAQAKESAAPQPALSNRMPPAPSTSDEDEGRRDPPE